MTVPDRTLTAALTDAIRVALGPVASVVRRPSPRASTAVLEDVTVRLADGHSRALVFKHGGRATAWEASVYRDVLAGAGLGTAELVAGSSAGDGWLLLAALDGAPLWESEDVAAWCDAARWLAAAHRALAVRGTARVLPAGPRRETRESQLRRAALADGRAAGLIEAHRTAVRLLDREPTTFVHGEAFPGNLLRTADGRTCALDWETAHVGCAMVDLAALTAGWDPASARQIAAAYGGDQRALPAARLVVAVQWLGAAGGRAAGGGTDWWLEADRAAIAMLPAR